MNYPISTNKPISQLAKENTGGKPYDIHERIFQFVIQVLKFIRQVSRTPENLIIIPQLSRAVTSVGANDQEADGVSTNNDFIHCFTVVRKELKETRYWVRVISVLNPTLLKDATEIEDESGELIHIVSSILLKSSKKRK